MSRPLDGIRVVDVCRGWAGPFATKILGDMGAEVIKVEAPLGRGTGQVRRPQKRGIFPPYPTYPNGDPGEQPWNREGSFNKLNRNKLSLALDLTDPRGTDIFKRLTKISDVVLDNFSSRTMKDFGLDYRALQEVNPAIIVISMPGHGTTGPYENYRALGTTIEAASGFSSLAGYSDGGPLLLGIAYADPIASLNAVSAVLLALWHRGRTGKGQFVDLSQCEAMISLIGENIVSYQVTRKLPMRMGNRHPSIAPHGSYRCKGEDEWVAISVSSDREWESFCEALGNPSWTKDEKFSHAFNRWHNQDEIDRLITEWTIEYSHYEAMQALQKAGVPAGVILNNKEMVTDAHLNARSFFVPITQLHAGTHLYPKLPIRFSKTVCDTWNPAPGLGEHNRHILIDLLDMPETEVTQLEQDKVVVTRPPT